MFAYRRLRDYRRERDGTWGLGDETGWHHGETNGCRTDALRSDRDNTYTAPKITNASVASLAVIRPPRLGNVVMRGYGTTHATPERREFADVRRM